MACQRFLARWVPRHLTEDQKWTGLDISRYLLSRYEVEPDFIYRIVTQDKTWVHHFDPESIKTEHAVDAPWLIPSEEIQERATSREEDGFNILG
jgi:hypothetical protein